MAIAPLPATRGSSRERRQISRPPSASESAPQVTAAAISPTEWPMTASGRTPYERHTAARPTCIAKIMLWIRSTPS